MTVYAGPPRPSGQVAITAPSGTDLASLADGQGWARAGGARESTQAAVAEWTAAAEERSDILLFEIAEDLVPVGQIFLHDIDEGRREALVGYHLLAEERRGRGIGTAALELLVDFVRQETALEHLVIITAGDNVRSRRIAEKSGFQLAGPPREDPTGLCFKLEVKRC